MKKHDEAAAALPQNEPPVKLTKWQRMTPEQRAKHSATVSAWKKRNLMAYRAQRRRYRVKNLVSFRVYNKRYRDAHPERITEWRRNWNRTNPEKVRAMAETNKVKRAPISAKYQRDRRDANPEKSKQYQRRRYHKNPQKSRAMGRIHACNRRARAGSGRLSNNIVEVLTVAQGGLCRYCRTALTTVVVHLDHIIPLSKGGPNIDSNVQLLCQRCNQRKHAKDPEAFKRELAQHS